MPKEDWNHPVDGIRIEEVLDYADDFRDAGYSEEDIEKLCINIEGELFYRAFSSDDWLPVTAEVRDDPRDHMFRMQRDGRPLTHRELLGYVVGKALGVSRVGGQLVEVPSVEVEGNDSVGLLN